ncbi:MAG: metal ABC transporter substrate-binding protein [Dehalococcoidia bacterium]
MFTSIYPLQYFAERVGGDTVSVHSMVRAGAEVHSFEPSPADLQRLAGADLLLLNGLGIEPWADRTLDALGDAAPRTISLGEALEDQAEASAEVDDPHLWLDPLTAIAQAKLVAEALSIANPDSAAQYAANALPLLGDLQDLHEEFQTTLSECAHRTFVTTHAAYGHLAGRYGLEQISVTGLSPEAEPSARHLAELAELIADRGIEHILAEPSLSDRYAETIARESGADILELHQIGSVTSAELEEHGDYLGLMRDNLASLSLALGCAS